MTPHVTRILEGPIVHDGLCDSLGGNINGPSLIKVPEWVRGKLGVYYLYFAHHEGQHIRMAFADHLRGPWTVLKGGVLDLGQTPLPQEPPDVAQPKWAQDLGVDGLYAHIASPDVHVGANGNGLRMCFHGLDHDGQQRSLMAVSNDGLAWSITPKRIDWVYLRLFSYQGRAFALAHGGDILEWRDGSWALASSVFRLGFRHGAVRISGAELQVFWTKIGDAPERIYLSKVRMVGDPLAWQLTSTQEILRPQMSWEGADLPVTPTKVGTAFDRENGLRDPCIYEENGRIFLIYAGGGESALGLAEVHGLG